MQKNNHFFQTRSRVQRKILTIFTLIMMVSIATTAAQGAPINPQEGIGMQQDSADQEASASVPVTFKNQVVDSMKLFHWMGTRSLALDSAKRPHIAYGGDKLYYVYYDGSNWQYQVVDTSPGVGKYASLALDPNNRPHISYFDATNGALKYARKIGANWELFVIDKAPTSALRSLAEGEYLDIDGLAPVGTDVEKRDWHYTLPGSGNIYGDDPEAELALGEIFEANPFIEEVVQLEIEKTEAVPEETQAEPAETESSEAEAAPAVGEDAPSIELTEEVTQVQYDEQLAEAVAAETLYAASDIENGRGLFTSIALNIFGYPGISYYDSIGENLKYAYWNGAYWDIRTLDTAGNVGMYSALAMDSSSYPHISYYDADKGDLKYMRWNGTAWTAPAVIDNGGDSTAGTKYVGLYTSIATDSSKFAHISYYDASNGDLKYARNTSTGWLRYAIDYSGDVGLYTSISVDSSARAHISYYRQTDSDLKYAMCTNNACNLYFPVTSGNVGIYTSIALDGTTPRISYFDLSAGQLRYTALSGSTWNVTPLDTAADFGAFTSMAVDSSGRQHISYLDDLRDDLRYAFWNGSSWEKYTLDWVGDVGLYSSLALSKTNGKPRISYYDASNQHLKYAWLGDTSWHLGTVDNTQFSGAFSSLALNSSEYPRIAYCKGKGCTTLSTSDPMELQVAFWTGSVWTIKTIDTNGVGLFTSIKVDSANFVHVSYYDAKNKMLKYAKGAPDGSTWSVQIADSSNQVGLFTSLVVDGNNRPHIAYFDDYYDRLKYAYFDGTGWRHEIADNTGGVGFYPTIAIDSSGGLHISYYDNSNRNLRYARRVGNGWTRQVVDSDGEVGKYSSIAFSSSGMPLISYYDATNGDLKYATSEAAKVLYLPSISR